MCVSIHVLQQQKETRLYVLFIMTLWNQRGNERHQYMFFYGIFCHAFDARKLKII